MSDYEIPVSGGVNGLNVPLHGHIAVYNKEFPVIPNPDGEVTGYVTKLGFTPEILQVKDPEVHDWARAEEKPTYTKAEVGLGEVDNTSDLDKPISTATQTALDGKVNNSELGNYYTKFEVNSALDNKADKSDTYTKTETDNLLSEKADSSSVYTKTETDTALGNKVDKVQGKGLSTNDYDDTAKGIVDGVTSALDNKVDKDGDKVLSDNNYSDTDKSIVGGVTSALADKVDKVEGYGLSQNNYTDEEKAKVGEIDNKLDKTETAVNSNGLVIATPVTDTAPYIYRQTPVKESFKALMHKIVGASVVWNQLGFETGISATGRYSPMFAPTGSSFVIDLISGHKYYVSFIQPIGCSVYRQNRTGLTVGYLTYSAPTINTRREFVCSCTENQTQVNTGVIISKNETTEESYALSKCMWVDLTAMFGTTIADYVYTLETSQSGSGIAWLQSYGFFTEDYYTYKQNKLESGCVSAHKTYDGETLLTNTELSPISLRGLFKLSTNKLTVDGDEYNADGSVTRKYEQRAYQSGDESLANAITDGTNTIVKLATPTTEQTTPFTETEIVGSTEEFIDYGVTQDNRDVAIPVGTETDYYQEMKLPSLPTTSGNHNLIYNVATGFGWS